MASMSWFVVMGWVGNPRRYLISAGVAAALTLLGCARMSVTLTAYAPSERAADSSFSPPGVLGKVFVESRAGIGGDTHSYDELTDRLRAEAGRFGDVDLLCECSSSTYLGWSAAWTTGLVVPRSWRPPIAAAPAEFAVEIESVGPA